MGRVTVKESSSVGGKRTIQRSQFKEAIENAIRETHESPSYSEGHLPVEELMEIAETATECDVHAWRIRGSCGCPMVLAGAVDTGEVSDGGLPSTHVITGFAGRFDANIDKLMRRHLGQSTLEVVG